jgi:ketosteroid isomerase-like protein
MLSARRKLKTGIPANWRKNMKTAGAILLVLACVGQALAQTPTAPAKGPSVSEAVKQLEHDWTDAVKAGDADKLGQILADDWAGIAYDGNKETKQSMLADVKSGAQKLDSFEFGPMDVKVLGSVAVVQGSDTEKSTTKGKDSSGKWVWMDVFVKRDGKWVAVRSQSAKVK